MTGLLNKQIGFELGISEITVKAHRGQVMRKMGAKSLASLVTMAGKIGLAAAYFRPDDSSDCPHERARCQLATAWVLSRLA